MSRLEPTRCYHCHAEVSIRRSPYGKWRPYNFDGTPHNCDAYHRNTKKSLVDRLDDLGFVDLSPADISALRARPTEGQSELPLYQGSVDAHRLECEGSLRKTPKEVGRTVKEEQPLYETQPLTHQEDSSRPSPPHRGPVWRREEILLATELYLRHQGVLFGPQHPEVIELSEILNRLPLYLPEERDKKFRNPNGVAMKLSNIRSVDPHARSKGNANGSKLDNLYWTELGGSPSKLSREIAAIKQRYPSVFVRDKEMSTPDRNERPRPEARTVKVRQVKESFAEPEKPTTVESAQIAPLHTEEESSWQHAVNDLRAQPWFHSLRKEDPRFDWFTHKFRGHVRPSVLYLHEWLTIVVQSPRLVVTTRPDVEEALLRFHDYLLYLEGLSLEDELFSIISAVSPHDQVATILHELEWDAASGANEGMGIQTTMTLHSIQRGWFWTPALDRALTTLQRESVHDVRLLGPALRRQGVALSSSFSANGLYMACKAFGKPLPSVLATMDEN